MALSAAEALGKRDELVTRGYTSIPGVMPPAMVEELRAWSDAIFARTERSNRRRTLLPAWHDVFSFPRPPSWWSGHVPAAVRSADPNAHYENSVRAPSHYLA